MNPRATNNAGTAPIHFAVRQNHHYLIDDLVKHGADINQADGKGQEHQPYKHCGQVLLTVAVVVFQAER